MAKRRLVKEARDFDQNHLGLLDTGYCHGGPLHGDLFQWEIILKGPKNSPYETGQYVLDIQCPKDYPFKPPKLTFITKIYHPCINKNGKVCTGCFHYLKDNWSPALTISRIIFKLYWLLQTNDSHSHLYTCTLGSVEASQLCRTNTKQFNINASQHTNTHANKSKLMQCSQRYRFKYLFMHGFTRIGASQTLSADLIQTVLLFLDNGYQEIV
eukprot:426067_1